MCSSVIAGTAWLHVVGWESVWQAALQGGLPDEGDLSSRDCGAKPDEGKQMRRLPSVLRI